MEEGRNCLCMPCRRPVLYHILNREQLKCSKHKSGKPSLHIKEITMVGVRRMYKEGAYKKGDGETRETSEGVSNSPGRSTSTCVVKADIPMDII